MATSNVDYYQKQKDLHDSMNENEQKRKRLEAQLDAYCRSDQKMSKLRAVKLQSYWKKICDDEKRSKQRNAQLMRDLDRVEANMATLTARREKLKQMKQQYFDYIERAYPEWMELVIQKKQEHHQQQHQQQLRQQQAAQQQYHNQQQQHQQQQQQHQQQQLLQQQQQQQQRQQQYQSSQSNYSSQQQQQHQQQYQSQHAAYQQSQQYETQALNQEDEEDEPPPPLPRQPPPASTSKYNNYDINLPEREYTNLKDIKRQPQTSSAPQTIPSVTVHMPSVGEGDTEPSKPGRPDSGKRLGNSSHNWMAAEKDTSIHSFSEQDEVPISQPVQSVTVRQKSEPPKTVIQPNLKSEEDVSDFSDEPDLPSAEIPPPVQHPMNPPPAVVTTMAGDADDRANEDDDDDDDDDFQSPVVFHPAVSTEGLLRLMKHIEDDLSKSLAVEAFYRSRNPDPSMRKEIVHKANSEGSLQTLDGEFVSMVVLEQLTPVVRRLPGGCLLSDILLVRKLDSLTESEIRDNLHRDSQILWDRLLDHFVCLVTNRVMGTREIAHVFVPCLVHDSSQHQDKAVGLLEKILDKLVLKLGGKESPVQHDSITMASSQQGGVPPLKFGSLIDSKAISDEESSMITQSMNTTDVPKVPLNETEAYKNLLAGNRPVQTAVADDTDNSDNDLEKQFVSTLSPRSHASKPPFPNPSTAISSSDPVVRDESHDQSGDQSHDHEEPHSEVSSPLASPVYVPTGAEASTVKSILGSTGGSSQQRKLAGMISSDLDTDTEVDIGTMGNKKDDDDDDFYDFYG